MEAEGSARAKKPYKRKLTDKRRLQNRSAQRTYRQKRKERLEYLEKAVAGTQPASGDTAPGSRSTASPSSPNEDAIDTSSAIEDLQLTFRTGDRIFVDYSWETAPPVSAAHPGLDGDILLRPMPANELLTALAQSRQIEELPVLQLRKDLGLENEAGVNDLLEQASAKQLGARDVILAGLRAIMSQEQEATQLASQTFQRSGALSGHFIPSISNIMTNGVFLRHQKFAEVIAENSRLIGLTMEQMVRPYCPSPWYTPLPTIQDVPTSTVPPDLHPTPSQRRLPHHPFFDLIPIPWFRERVIALMAIDPPVFDRFDLKKDILRGGMVCWKSRARDSGQPWDRRSWEVEPWFAEKWGWLIEEQGKVEQQSKWWRALRGA
ncbi:hypothetical protein BDV96DRAFT_599162 [Lophiotrema nucula]|uniref:BZIP domain-containing protein n=1 Tax=Lophiotrema nucula TaxID=690887 RepID=A0A6A5ZBM2_9PLEO|nr:hypothetical protein BDV96DRAFT_599162 [Lophiotrema nucula]